MLKATEAIEILSDVIGRLTGEKTEEGYIRDVFSPPSPSRAEACRKIWEAILWLREEDRKDPGL